MKTLPESTQADARAERAASIGDAEPVPLVNPDLLPIGIAVATSIVAVLVMSLGLTLLGRGNLVNPEFVEVFFTANAVIPDTLSILALITGFGFVAFPSWAIADAWINRAKASRR